MGKNCCDRESVLGFTMRGVNTGKAIGMMWQIIWRWRRVGSFFWVSQVVSGIIWRLVVLDFHPRQYMIFTSVYIYIYTIISMKKSLFFMSISQFISYSSPFIHSFEWTPHILTSLELR
jgi:hypothetical protein